MLFSLTTNRRSRFQTSATCSVATTTRPIDRTSDKRSLLISWIQEPTPELNTVGGHEPFGDSRRSWNFASRWRVGSSNTIDLREGIVMHTVASEPPEREDVPRRSRWAELFDECRLRPNEWRKICPPMSKSTASQIASDLRNVHRRDPEKSRLHGLRGGERWEAIWAQEPDDTERHGYFVWLRYVVDPEMIVAPPSIMCEGQTDGRR